jgi:hypothetical protein
MRASLDSPEKRQQHRVPSLLPACREARATSGQQRPAAENRRRERRRSVELPDGPMPAAELTRSELFHDGCSTTTLPAGASPRVTMS